MQADLAGSDTHRRGKGQMMICLCLPQCLSTESHDYMWLLWLLWSAVHTWVHGYNVIFHSIFRIILIILLPNTWKWAKNEAKNQPKMAQKCLLWTTLLISIHSCSPWLCGSVGIASLGLLIVTSPTCSHMCDIWILHSFHHRCPRPEPLTDFYFWIYGGGWIRPFIEF
jgi:hypothetical protein